MHRLIAVTTIVIGLVLMMAKINADSEPGAIPILLVALGIGWHVITQLRAQAHHK